MLIINTDLKNDQSPMKHHCNFIIYICTDLFNTSLTLEPASLCISLFGSVAILCEDVKQ